MVLKSNVESYASRYCYSYSRKKNVIFKVQVKASTSIVKVFALPFEVICINQILGTSVKYYKRNNSRAKYYLQFHNLKMPFMFCGASLIFSLYNSCKTNNARVLKIMVTHPPSPPKKN